MFSHSVDFWLTRFVFMRGIGAIYFVAFLSLFHQLKPLIGKDGLLPAHLYIKQVTRIGIWKAFWRSPSLFYFNSSDAVMVGLCGLGVGLSFAVMMGLSNGLSLLILWMVYLSFANIGQIFYGYGWEMMLLEVGFLSIFLYPFTNLEWFPAHYPPSKIVMLLLLWVLFRNMLGAGLIKLRGDKSWRDWTALFYHFETQPIPNPLSRWFHFLPKWVLKAGVAFNHFVELVVPFLYFGPRITVIFAGLLTVLFQVTLILSGNLSFLNWITIVMCIPCFDDRVWAWILPQSLVSQIPAVSMPIEGAYHWILWGLFGVVAYLSIKPIMNLCSSCQSMNCSYDPFYLVNSYGAFGSIGQVRNEIIIKGTSDMVATDHTVWKEYEFYAKPGDIDRRPPVISPYHYRLDWQVWFAAMGHYSQNPWLLHLVYKLLQNDPLVLSLIRYNPFKEGAPQLIKIDLYRYEFSKAGTDAGKWWKRELVGEYLMPLSLQNRSLKEYIYTQFPRP